MSNAAPPLWTQSDSSSMSQKTLRVPVRGPVQTAGSNKNEERHRFVEEQHHVPWGSCHLLAMTRASSARELLIGLHVPALARAGDLRSPRNDLRRSTASCSCGPRACAVGLRA